MRKLYRLLLLAGCLSAMASAATIIIVRHAERANGMTADALLSPAGEERAKVLSQVLKDAGIQRIYTTEVRRVQQTAEPIATWLKLKPVVVPQKDIDELVKQLRAVGNEEAVLVVGHTNTIPAIVERLGGGTVAPLGDSEYDRLTVVVTGSGKPRVVTLRYGNPSQ